MTPNSYLQKIRLDKAKEYLVSTDLSLTCIAQNVGYEQQSSLTRLFKKHLGMTPKAFRQNYRDMVK